VSHRYQRHHRHQVIEGVAVLGEDHQFPAVARRVEHFSVVLQQPRQLVPFAIGAGLPDAHRPPFQFLELGDLGAQLGDGAGRRRLIDDALLSGLYFGVGGIVQIVEIILGKRGQAGGQVHAKLAPRFRSCSSRSRFSSRSFLSRSDW